MASVLDKIELIAPCHFGLEAVLKRELLELGYEITRVEDGKVHFSGGLDSIPRANLFLRTAERVLLKVGSFRAESFEELFESIRAIPWETYIPADGKVWVTKANSVKSKLFSPSDIQSIVKKAIVERLKTAYHTEIIPESGSEYPLRVSILKDLVTVGIDTSGVSLHKRGYRTDTVKAPISETLAAALIMLTPWKEDRILVDPFTGSGTIPIEAAMMAARIAPGLNRAFTAEEWKNLLPKKLWYEASVEAMDIRKPDVRTEIQGYDVDPSCIRFSKENARRAEVDNLIHFQVRDVRDLSHRKKYGFLITNPPYGERLFKNEDMHNLYRTIGERFSQLDSWSMYLITSYEDAEHDIGRKADKNRKIYNGMLKTYFYSFQGPKPPKEKREWV